MEQYAKNSQLFIDKQSLQIAELTGELKAMNESGLAPVFVLFTRSTF